jgi:ABC-2 type transport system ATP-binding protein
MGFTKLDGLAEKPIRGLSKGMKQRLCLGRSMIHDPSVLILDEPAAGLDPRARIELRQMIRELADRGKTVLVSSHILTELAEMCDRVGIIERGELLAVGTVAEIQRGQITHCQIKARIIENVSTAAAWLGERADIENIRVDGQLIRFSHVGETDEQAKLLREMILAEFAVAEFGIEQRSLEDVFMHVTRGVVQ